MMSRLAESHLLEWLPVSACIIKAQFYSKFNKLTFIQVYALTMETEEGKVDKFYDPLQSVLQKVKKHDILLMSGDFNSKSGTSNRNRRSHGNTWDRRDE